MRITEVKVSLRDDAKLKAFVTVTFDECFVVRGMKIIHAQKGMFVAMPTRRKPDGTFQDIAHPIRAGAREELEKHVFAAYRLAVERGDAASPASHEEFD